jgi:hypothetical protein
VIIDDSH